MLVELTRVGLRATPKYPIVVKWRSAVVGDYEADLLVEECVLVELKACKCLDEVHVAQCLNYLKATGIKVCLLINFGTTKIQIRRLVNNL
jgi:GxxExxY protein